MTASSKKALLGVLLEGEAAPSEHWQVRVISSGDCQSYGVWNTTTQESLLIDPKKEDREFYLQLKEELKNYLWLAVIDTHTHADHISAAAEMADIFQAPLIMQAASGSSKVQIRIVRTTHIASRSAPLRFIPTPGHTADGMCVQWGPFAFTGDTVLFGDVGRDDLPGGDPAMHYDSLQTLGKFLSPETLILPGHDHKGGRVASWATQLKINSSLTQPRDEYIQESAAFDAPAPALLKKALFENLR